jgi:hypothetical protein
LKFDFGKNGNYEFPIIEGENPVFDQKKKKKKKKKIFYGVELFGNASPIRW